MRLQVLSKAVQDEESPEMLRHLERLKEIARIVTNDGVTLPISFNHCFMQVNGMPAIIIHTSGKCDIAGNVTS